MRGTAGLAHFAHAARARRLALRVMMHAMVQSRRLSLLPALAGALLLLLALSKFGPGPGSLRQGAARCVPLLERPAPAPTAAESASDAAAAEPRLPAQPPLAAAAWATGNWTAPLPAGLLDRGIVSDGDATARQRLAAKLLAGEPITVGELPGHGPAASGEPLASAALPMLG